MKSGFDSVAMSPLGWQLLVPANPEVIGAYLNGLYANAAAARQAFPHAIHYTYDVDGSRPDADVLDIERYDATVQQAPGWFHAWHQHGPHTLPKPGFYTSAGAVQALIDTMTTAGISRNQYLILSAHYQAGEHICGPSICHYPQADGTQWDDHGDHGQNIDRLLYNDSFFPAPVKPHGQAHVLLTLDLATGAWTMHPLPGIVHWGSVPRRASLELQLETGGQHAGQWRNQPLPFNAPPLG